MSNRIAQNQEKFSHQGEKPGGLVRIWRALFYSLAGIGAAYRSEAAFRQEIWLAAVLAPVVFILPIALLFQAYLIGSIFLVLMMELINSAIEAVVDKLIPEVDFSAKNAKDMGSAAVFLALVHGAFAWGAALVTVYRRYY